jgi:hypothetical protein
MMLGIAVLGVGVLAAFEGILPEMAGGLVIGVVLTALGGAGLAIALGLWRRRRWAWMASLVLQGLNVIQVVLVIASSGLQGAIGLGLFTGVVTPLEFFYLTRPHVAAAFGHRRVEGRGPARPARPAR